MGLFDFFANMNRKLDAIISYDAKRNAGKVLITSNIATKLSELNVVVYKLNDDDEWVDSFLYSIEYTNEDDDAGDETKAIHLELTPGLPYSLDFSLETFKSFTKENIEKYYLEAKNDGSFEDGELGGFLEAFLDPKWSMEVSVDGVTLGEIEFEYINEEILNFISSVDLGTSESERGEV